MGPWSFVGSADPAPGAHPGEACMCFGGAQGVSWCIFAAIGERLQTVTVQSAAACIVKWQVLEPKTCSLRNNKPPVGHPPSSLPPLRKRTAEKKKKKEKHLRDQREASRPHRARDLEESPTLHLPRPGGEPHPASSPGALPALRSELASPRRGACVCV